MSLPARLIGLFIAGVVLTYAVAKVPSNAECYDATAEVAARPVRKISEALFHEKFKAILAAEASSQDIKDITSLYATQGIAKIKLTPEEMAQLPRPEIPAEGTEAANQQWKRYGSPDKPVFAFPIAGKVGSPGTVFIHAPKGETADLKDYANYNGPPHVHKGVSHITIVTKGSGHFVMEGDTIFGRRMVIIEVNEGDAVLIPEGFIHTFHTGTGGQFHLVSATSEVVPVADGRFLDLTPQSELDKLPPIPYDDFQQYRRR